MLVSQKDKQFLKRCAVALATIAITPALAHAGWNVTNQITDTLSDVEGVRTLVAIPVTAVVATPAVATCYWLWGQTPEGKNLRRAFVDQVAKPAAILGAGALASMWSAVGLREFDLAKHVTEIAHISKGFADHGAALLTVVPGFSALLYLERQNIRSVRNYIRTALKHEPK